MDKKGFEPEYDDNKIEDKVYLHQIKTKADGAQYRYIEMLLGEEKCLLEKNNTNSTEKQKFSIIREQELYVSDGGQQKIVCSITTPSNGNPYFTGLHIARRSSKGIYGSNEVVLSFDSAYKLKCFLNQLFTLNSENKHFKVLDTAELISKEAGNIVEIGVNDFENLVNTNLDYLNYFENIISLKKKESAVATLKRIINGEYRNETEITRFLKDNLWMFGSEYVIFAESGKIHSESVLDIMPQTFENFVDIIEVKLPSETLFRYDDSHQNYYCSSSLTKAIAQTQNYIFQLEQQTAPDKNEKGYKVVKPTATILYGTKETLTDVEENYLRLLNSSYHNLKILTFQQLLEKAKVTIKLLSSTKE